MIYTGECLHMLQIYEAPDKSARLCFRVHRPGKESALKLFNKLVTKLLLILILRYFYPHIKSRIIPPETRGKHTCIPLLRRTADLMIQELFASRHEKD